MRIEIRITNLKKLSFSIGSNKICNINIIKVKHVNKAIISLILNERLNVVISSEISNKINVTNNVIKKDFK